MFALALRVAEDCRRAIGGGTVYERLIQAMKSLGCTTEGIILSPLTQNQLV